MGIIDDIKNKIKNINTDKLKSQIGDATERAKNTVHNNLNNLKNGDAGDKFNKLKGEYSKMTKNKKIIFGICAIVVLFIIICGINSIAVSEDTIKTKIDGKWDCGMAEFNFNTKDNNVIANYKMFGDEAIGKFNITKHDEQSLYIDINVKGEREIEESYKIVFDNDNVATFYKNGGSRGFVCKKVR